MDLPGLVFRQGCLPEEHSCACELKACSLRVADILCLAHGWGTAMHREWQDGQRSTPKVGSRGMACASGNRSESGAE
eukprot:5349841-Amphidinium_carterae.1